MMKIAYITKRLHKFERKSKFVKDLFSAVSNQLDKITSFLDVLKAQFFFDTITIALPLYEKMMKITPLPDSSLADRRTTVQARWRATGHNSIKLIQELCEYFIKGDIEAKFVGGKIRLNFINSYGIPSENLFLSLINQINEVKPAHLALLWKFRYLLIKDIHKKMTINDMQTYTISQYGHYKEAEV